ncbi:MAG: TadE family protein [Beijerinckiaceae bacterium]
MFAKRKPGLVSCVSGATAVESAIVLPAFLMFLIGLASAGVVVFSAALMHYVVEEAARCYSVNSSTCGSATATQSYAKSTWKKNFLGVSSPTFTASTQSCGYQVNATLSLVLDAGMAKWTVPLSATACFP